MSATTCNKAECIELSDWAKPGDMIIILGIEGRLHHAPAMYDDDLMWVQIDSDGLTDNGKLQRFEPHQITAWRPAYIAAGIEVELAAKYPW